MVLEAEDTSEKKSLNLMRPSMLCPTTVMIPAMLAVAARASMVGLSWLLRDLREHDDSLAYQMKKDKALHAHVLYIYINIYMYEKRLRKLRKHCLV